jgi:hypothetical protein
MIIRTDFKARSKLGVVCSSENSLLPLPRQLPQLHRRLEYVACAEAAPPQGADWILRWLSRRNNFNCFWVFTARTDMSHLLWDLVQWKNVSKHNLILLYMKMAATCSSETSLEFQLTTWPYIPQDIILHSLMSSLHAGSTQNTDGVSVVSCSQSSFRFFFFCHLFPSSSLSYSFPSLPLYCLPPLAHSWSWDLLEKLPIVQLLKNFPAFYGTRRFITGFTRALHWSLSWARSIRSIPSHPISLRSILILSTHLWPRRHRM